MCVCAYETAGENVQHIRHLIGPYIRQKVRLVVEHDVLRQRNMGGRGAKTLARRCWIVGGELSYVESCVGPRSMRGRLILCCMKSANILL